MITQVHRRITTNATTAFFTKDIFITEISFFCSDAGNDWDIRVEDNAASPAVILKGELSLSTTGVPTVIGFSDGERRPGLRMTSGVDVVTSNSTGSDTGVVDVWITGEIPG